MEEAGGNMLEIMVTCLFVLPPPPLLLPSPHISESMYILILGRLSTGVSRNQRFQDINAMKEDKTMLKNTF